MTANSRLLKTIRACYWLEGSDQQWLEQILTSLLHETDHTRGMACFFRVGHTGLFLKELVLEPCDVRHLNPFLELTSSPALRLAMETGRSHQGMRGWHWSAQEQPLFQRWRHTCPSMADSLTLWSMDTDGTGCVLVFPDWMARPESRGHAARWSHFVEHLAHGYWIRRRARNALCRLLERSAGNELAWNEITRQLDHHSGRSGEGAADTAVEVCDGLLTGLWTLLGHWQHGGRRYVLAHGRGPSASWQSTTQPRLALTAREHEILRLAMRPLDYRTYQEIGHALGCRSNTIANHMARLLRKIGVTTHAELLAVLAPLATDRHWSTRRTTRCSSRLGHSTH